MVKKGDIVEFVPWYKSFKNKEWIVKGKIMEEHKVQGRIYYDIKRIDKKRTFECSKEIPKNKCPSIIYRLKTGHKFRKVK